MKSDCTGYIFYHWWQVNKVEKQGKAPYILYKTSAKLEESKTIFGESVAYYPYSEQGWANLPPVPQICVPSFQCLQEVHQISWLCSF